MKKNFNAELNIIKKCEEISTEDEIITFLGWKNGFYENQNSKIILNNSKTGETWNTTSYSNFMNKSKIIKNSFNYYKIHNLGNELNDGKEVLNRIKEIHKDKNWNFDNFEYKGCHNPVKIFCNEINKITGQVHGYFYPSTSNLLRGSGCPKCSGKYRYDKEEFILRSKHLFGNLYDYSKVTYINNFTKVILICKIHGEFEITPNSHLSQIRGCPKCSASKGELLIIKYLRENNINYSYQVKYSSKLFSGCPNKEKVEIDFVLELENRKIWIEFNGEQHYKDACLFHKDERHSLEKQKQRDSSIRKYAHTHGIELLEIPYVDINRIPEILDKFLVSGQDITTKIN